MRNLLKLASLSLIASVAACTSSPAEMKDPPMLKVTSPERSLMKEGAGMIEVRGEVGPNIHGDAVQKVMVNGVQATMTEGGQFVAQIQVKPGATLIQTEAIDVEGGKATDTRAVAAGELRGPGAMINDAIAVGLSDDSLHAIGKAAGNIMAQTDMAPILAPMNPMVKAGLEPDGSEDCLYGKVSVYDVDMSKAIIDLAPVAGGLQFSLNLKDLKIPMHARYAASCLDGDTDISVSADDVKVTGTLNVTPNGKSFDVKLVDQTVVLTGFHMDASGVPGAVLDILPLDRAAEYIIEKGAEAFMGPMVNDAFGAMAGTKTVDVLGKKLDVDVFPSDVYFDPAAAHIVLSTRLKIQGTESSKGFIYTPNAALDLNPSNGFKFGMADDAANQLLSGVAAAGMMNLSMPAPGGTFDTTAIAVTLPPMISADPTSGKMQLIAGDMMMTFLQSGKPVAKAALNVKMDVKVKGTGSNVGVDFGEPVVAVNVIEDTNANLTGFTNGDLEKMVVISVDHQMAIVKALMGNIPLPAIGGVSLKNLSVAGDDGYVVISGSME
jgi:hypothetical protein